ncbi:MAG: hypothetical protein MUO38_04000 [Anaerolineales bacterium]|jgi:hypothetical protein|nr:hypothetical protein [Anaerolineales bacterium]
MARTVAIVFLVLHGLVHLLYLGQAAKVFELRPGLTWPAGSWLFSKAIGDNATRVLASVLCVMAALGLVVGAAGFAFDQNWWRSVVVAGAALSAVLYLLLWNGQLERLDQQGVVGILLDAVILVVALFFRWP